MAISDILNTEALSSVRTKLNAIIAKINGVADGAQVNTVDSVAGKTGAVTLETSDITGLQTALDGKVSTTGKAADSDKLDGLDSSAFVQTSGGTVSGLTLNDGYTEEVFVVTGTTPALSPTNGSIQTWTLSGNSTPTFGTFASGQ